MDNFLVAIVVPNIPQLRTMLGSATSEKLKTDEDICASAEACAAILESLAKTGREARLQGFEIIKAVYLEPVMWTPESEVMTPTLKLKRTPLREKYAAQLDALRQQVRLQSARK
jgi:long-chain acyl-CoA synthetase